MRRLYIWGTVLWATGWVFVWPNFKPVPSTLLWFGACGTLLIVVASWYSSVQSRRWHWSALLAAAALVAFGAIWNSPEYIGAYILAAGALTLVAFGATSPGARIGRGLAVAGTVALTQLVGLYLFVVYFGPRGHGAAIPSTILAAAFRLFGFKAAALENGLHLMSIDRLYQVVPSPNNMGLIVFLMVFMGLIGLAVVGVIRVRSLLTGAFIISVFALVRYAAIMLWDYTHEGLPDSFWSPLILAWTAWPVAIFLQRLPLFDRPRWYTPGVSHSGRRVGVVIGATAVGVLAWTAVEGYHPAGVMKPGRMLIDEMHSDWEWSEMPFDTVWYGQQSTYNFYCLAEYWGNYYRMERGFDSLTPELLDNYDILVLKVPTQPYAPGEIEAVYDWVCDGGGLILIGEHTNVFGYATFLNPVAQRFGQRFIPDIVYEIEAGDLNLERMRRLLPHPVAYNMPDDFLFGGPCSMYGDLCARSIITGVDVKTLPADYTERNFFPERTGHTGYRHGPLLLSMATRCGKGRIVSFTDSTLWSNFFVFIPGKPELALELADYVNRYDPFPLNYWRIVAVGVGLLGIAVAAIAALGMRLEGWGWMAATAGLVFTGSAQMIEAVNAKNYPVPQPHRQYAQLNFEHEHSDFFIPELRLAREGDKDFSTFFLWTQRVGIVPRRFPTLEEALAQPGGQMIIDPVRHFDSTEVAMCRQFVDDGGTLYIFDDPKNARSTSNPLLAQFGMRFDMTPIRGGGRTQGQGLLGVLWENGGRVIGGEPLVVAPDSSVSCARRRFGKGQVIAYAKSSTFERTVMGYTAMIPNPIQNTISQFEYRLMSYLNYPPERADEPEPEPDGANAAEGSL